MRGCERRTTVEWNETGARTMFAPAGQTTARACLLANCRRSLCADKRPARGKDLWFHVQKAPGSHCVVMSRGENIPDTTKQEAAELAVLHSSQNGGAKVAVDTTEVKNIWKANGAKPGMVLYEKYETAYITPDPALPEKLALKKK